VDKNELFTKMRLVPVAPAIANGICHTTGLRSTTLPLTPGQVIDNALSP
jgi:CO/xanthine dehydrogenase Mo-binding subunit